MTSFKLIDIQLILVAPSFNQPKFCTDVSWNPNAATFADSNIVGHYPYAIFVTSNNTVVAARSDNNIILIWRNGSVTPTTTTSPSNPSKTYGLFVTSSAEILVGYSETANLVDRWALNGTKLSSPMSTCSGCTGLFVDNHNNLYCSQSNGHQVVRTSLSNPDNTLIIVAGTGCRGSTSDKLSHPYGIFVTIGLDLYVADSWNQRVQLFRAGEMHAETVADSKLTGDVPLSAPTGVVLDADGCLFIVDSGNNRIIRLVPNGFRCVVGCSRSNGLASNELNTPQTLSFDSDGNMFVTDMGNHRIQKFLLSNNSCSKWKWRMWLQLSPRYIKWKNVFNRKFMPMKEMLFSNSNTIRTEFMHNFSM